jgi:mono/diheme cytochrome c family protein
MKKLILAASISMGVVLFSCSKTEDPTTYDCTGLTPTYEKDIKAIMDKSCATVGCHDSKTASKKIDLSNYGQVKGHTVHDNFLGSIEHLKGYEAMPKKADKLADAQIKLIACWIKNGTPEK